MKRLIVTVALILAALYANFALSAPGDRTLAVSQSRFSGYSANRAAIPAIDKALANYTSINTNTANSLWRRVYEVRNAKGIIVYYVCANGKIGVGTPKILAITSVYPVNGATGIYNNYSGRCSFNNWSTSYICNKKFMASVTYNKGVSALSATTTQYVVGKTQELLYSDGAAVAFTGISTAPHTTYTIRVARKLIRQKDGEWASSCGSAMTDNNGVCESTFSTR